MVALGIITRAFPGVWVMGTHKGCPYNDLAPYFKIDCIFLVALIRVSFLDHGGVLVLGADTELDGEIVEIGAQGPVAECVKPHFAAVEDTA